MTMPTVEELRLEAESTLKELVVARQGWTPDSIYSLAKLDRAIQMGNRALGQIKGGFHD
jgi:hypothetical protein